MNASQLRVSRSHRARAAVNKANYEETLVQHVRLRSPVDAHMFLPAGVKVVSYGMNDLASWDVVIEVPRDVVFETLPGGYFEVISIELRRRT